MRARWQPAQQVFSGDLGGQQGPHGAVEGGEHHQSGGLGQAGQPGAEGGAVGHVLYHLQRGHHVEGGDSLGNQGFRRALAVVDDQAPGRGMLPGDAQRLGRRVQPGHLGAGLGQGFRHQAGTAADIQDPQPGQGLGATGFPRQGGADAGHDPFHPGGVHAVQRRHGALGVPPLRRDLVELGDFGRRGCSVHGMRSLCVAGRRLPRYCCPPFSAQPRRTATAGADVPD